MHKFRSFLHKFRSLQEKGSGVKKLLFPKGNGYVERFNRTLEESFIWYWEEELFEELCYAQRKEPIESQKIWTHTST
jgi:hypothetical protein